MHPDVGAAKDKLTVSSSELWERQLSFLSQEVTGLIDLLLNHLEAGSGFGAEHTSRQRFFVQFLRGFLSPTRHRLKD
jgi:hypothetical protein